MDKKYIDLFKELTKATAIAAEQVMDYDKSKNDEKGFETAMVMRDDFEALHDKIAADGFDGILTKADYAKLLVGTLIISNNLRDKVATLNKAIMGYEKELAPKLQAIVDDANDDIMAQKLAEESFIINDNK